jgi:hypothetical protein
MTGSVCTNEGGGISSFCFWGSGGRCHANRTGQNNEDKQFWKKVPCSQRKKGSAWTREGSSFSLSGKKGGRNLLLFSLVPIMYPMCSHDFFQVPNVFPKSFPIAPHFYCMMFGPNCNSHVYKLKR